MCVQAATEGTYVVSCEVVRNSLPYSFMFSVSQKAKYRSPGSMFLAELSVYRLLARIQRSSDP